MQTINETRELTAAETEVIEELYRRKQPYDRDTREYLGDLGPTHAYVTVVEPIPLRKWNGHHWKPEYTEEMALPGQTLKVVMISRLGDMGLTDSLESDRVYHVRLLIESPKIKNIRFTP